LDSDSVDAGTLFRVPGAGETPFSEISEGTIEQNAGFDYFAKTLSASDIVNGGRYKILFAGNTDFVSIGSPDNNVNTAFDATGDGSGTGVVCEVGPAPTNTPVTLGFGEVQNNGGPESPVGVFPDLNIKLRGYQKGIDVEAARTILSKNIF